MSINTSLVNRKSPLKWAGGKKRIVEQIRDNLPAPGKSRLVEPFVGGGSVFLNLTFDRYLLLDINPDLINFYKTLQIEPVRFIAEAEAYFNHEHNQAKRYYELRNRFNNVSDKFERSLLFLYLNRHGYNGLCRYNLKGGYNVPFGRYKKPYFPKSELLAFSNVARLADFHCGDFEQAFEWAKPGDQIYCDPPYCQLAQKTNFTSYSGKKFTVEDHIRLVECAIKAQKSGVTTILSNHDTPFTRELYSKATNLNTLGVQRSISSKGAARAKAPELIALYSA